LNGGAGAFHGAPGGFQAHDHHNRQHRFNGGGYGYGGYGYDDGYYCNPYYPASNPYWCQYGY
jgi:hypothetical protein